MVQEQHQAPAVPATGDAGGIPGAFCVYRVVYAYTRISAGDEEQYQPVLPYAGHVMDEHPADMRMDRILPKATATADTGVARRPAQTGTTYGIFK